MREHFVVQQSHWRGMPLGRVIRGGSANEQVARAQRTALRTEAIAQQQGHWVMRQRTK